MKVTWEQLGNPTEPGIIEVNAVGRVLLTDYDLEFSSPGNFDAVLIENKPESDWKIGSWAAREQAFFPNPLIK